MKKMLFALFLTFVSISSLAADCATGMCPYKRMQQSKQKHHQAKKYTHRSSRY